MRRTVKLNQVSGVNSGQKTTIRIVDSYAYHGFLFALTGFTAAQISDLRLFCDNIEVQAWTGADLDALNKYSEFPAAADYGLLYMPLTGAGLLYQGDEEVTAIHLGVPYKTNRTFGELRLELTIAAGISGTLGLDASALVRPAVAGRDELLPFVRRTNIDTQGAGIKTFNDLVNVRSPREAFVDRVMFKSANMLGLRVQVNQVDVFDRTRVVNEAVQKIGVRTPQAGYFVFDTRENGFGAALDALPVQGVQSCAWILNMSAAENIQAYVSSIGPLQ